MKRAGLIVGLALLATTLAPVALATDRNQRGYGGDFSEYEDDDRDDGSYERYERYERVSDRRHDRDDDRHRDDRYDDRHYYGKVIDSHPLYRTMRVPHTERECFDDVDRDYRGNDSYTGTIVGGIIGGVLGNGVGGGRGRDIATVAGTVLGGSIGRDLSRNGYNQPRYRERCETVTHYTQERRPAGYHVTYRYKGRIYETQTDYRPGKQIRIDPGNTRRVGYNDYDD